MQTTKTNRPKIGPILLITFGLILIAATLFLLQSIENPGAPTAAPLTPVDQISRVNLTDSKLAFDNNAAIFLDVRSRPSFEIGRIKGAINIPLAELETHYSELDSQKWIIPYCT
ncbi:MAG: hypothetical protein HPY59_06355 [Anaerolineae bacterium]|nr:hypothetical protein [Anaerolineae bacterium]